jgi:hypothetical protein
LAKTGCQRKKVLTMRRTILLATVLPFVSAFLGGFLAFSLAAAPQATAQSSELQEVRASAFTLVGADGTVLARLAPAQTQTGGRELGALIMYGATGTRRLTVTGAGTVNAYEGDGTTLVFRAGRSIGAAPEGVPSVNGVLLGPDGSIGMLPPSP